MVSYSMAEPSGTDGPPSADGQGGAPFLPSSRLVPHLLSHRRSGELCLWSGRRPPMHSPAWTPPLARTACYARSLPLAFFERRAGGREWRQPPIAFAQGRLRSL